MNTNNKKTYNHDLLTQAIVGDIILFVVGTREDNDQDFFTGTITDIVKKGVHIKYDDQIDDAFFPIENLRAPKSHFYILRLLPIDKFGEALLHSQLSNEYIHLVTQLGFKGTITDIVNLENIITYIDGKAI